MIAEVLTPYRTARAPATAAAKDAAAVRVNERWMERERNLEQQGARMTGAKMSSRETTAMSNGAIQRSFHPSMALLAFRFSRIAGINPIIPTSGEKALSRTLPQKNKRATIEQILSPCNKKIFFTNGIDIIRFAVYIIRHPRLFH